MSSVQPNHPSGKNISSIPKDKKKRSTFVLVQKILIVSRTSSKLVMDWLDFTVYGSCERALGDQL